MHSFFTIKSVFKTPYLYSLIFLLIFKSAFSQQLTQENSSDAIGLPFIKNYSVNEYNAAIQSWQVMEAPNGFLYFANSGGVLEFDGSNWRTYIPNENLVVRSLATNQEGDVFVGARNDFGILRPDSTHTLHFVSLLDKIPQDKREFGDVWEIFYSKQKGVILRTNHYLFIYNPKTDKTTTLEVEGGLKRSSFVNDNFYVKGNKNGLLYLNENNVLEPITDSSFGQAKIYGMISISENESLLFAPPNGTFKVKDKKLTAFPFASQDYLASKIAYCVTALPNGDIAIGTYIDGIFITDQKGNIKLHLNKKTGLQSNAIYDLSVDRNGNLLVAGNDGIDIVYLSIPYSYIGAAQNVEGFGLQLIYSPFYQRLYAGTTAGIYTQPFPQKLNQLHQDFTFLNGTEGFGLDALIEEKEVIFGGNFKLFSIKDTVATIIDAGLNNAVLIPIKNTGKYFIGRREGISIAKKNSEVIRNAKTKRDTTIVNWTVKPIANFESSAEDAVFYQDYFWLNSQKGVLKVKLSENYDSIITTKLYSVDEGLPHENENKVYFINQKLVVATQKGIYHYDEKQDRFIKEPLLEKFFEDGFINKLYQDKKGNIWYTTENETGVLWKKTDTIYEQQTNLLAPLVAVSIENINDFLPNKISFGTNNKFWILDTENKFNIEQKPTVFIRKIEFLGEKDSLLFGGAFSESASSVEKQTNPQQLELEFEFNALRFSFSSPYMIFEEHNKYRYKLDGLDDKWSVWSNKSQKEYTNLSEGNYKFRVQSKNIWNAISEETIYEFRILPPLYRTWWAYLIYFVSFIILIWLVVKLNTQRLERDKRNLENTITQRTAEVMQQKEELEAQAQNLLEANNSIQTQKQEIEKSYQNIKVLSEIGQKITTILNVEELTDTVYQNVNKLMSADAFGIGIFNESKKRLDFEGFREKGKVLPTHSDSVENNKKLSAQSFNNNKRIVINDLQNDFLDYFEAPVSEAEIGELPNSLVYLPLTSEGKIVGVLTVQSMDKNVYNELELSILDTLGAYTAIALDNIKAYQIIESKNKNITDSIRYAETIQKAVLRIDEELKNYFENYFVIFRAKDIVSGDFYWVRQTEKQIFVAVIDCTGHGVPGAFMSMLGNAFLNEAVNQKKLSDPAATLEWLDGEIKHSLLQDQNANADGMDVSLCVIDKLPIYDSNINKYRTKITYSGAKRPLVYVEPDASIETIKGDRRSIGGHVNEKTARKVANSPFTNQVVEVEKETMIYIFSDGFVDQSNPEGKKIGTSTLLSCISEISDFSVSEQKQKLTDLLDNHQLDTPQRDDITFMGIRI